MIRNNKPLLFGSLGLAGGALGALIGELAPTFGKGTINLIGGTAIWSAMAASIVAVALFAASEIYHRRQGFYSKQTLRYLTAGAVGGGIAGAVAQTIYGAQFGSPAMQNFILRPICWGLMGGILGWRLASTIPNLNSARAAIGGSIGGTLGGIAFLIACAFLPETFGRMVGIGFVGAALGLAIVVADAFFREATLEIVWGPKEVTTVALGRVPVTIGGGDDHICVSGLPPAAASIVIEQGKIQYVDSATNHRTDLRDGSKIKIGSIEVIVHTTR